MLRKRRASDDDPRAARGDPTNDAVEAPQRCLDDDVDLARRFYGAFSPPVRVDVRAIYRLR